MRDKILSLPAADEWVREQRGQARRIGFTCGAFDLLHAGHVDLLERARLSCDRLLVAVNSDASIRRYKSLLRPVNPEQDRMQVVAALASVDAVVLLDDDRPLRLIERWRPDLYIKGGDYASGGLRSGAAVESYGGKVVLLPFSEGQSTSSMIDRIGLLGSHCAIPLESKRCDTPRVVFLDRDGTLIRHIAYLHDPDRVELLPGVPEGLLRLQQNGFRLAIVTNQQGIGLGYFTLEAFFEVDRALFAALAPYGVKIDRVYFCPHSLADDCACRKPGTALLAKALSDYRAAPGDCWMLGDNESDVVSGEAAGCRALLIRDGVPADEKIVHTFGAAVDRILGGT